MFNGPYGPYLKAGKTNVGLPEGITAESITAEKAFSLMTEKLGDVPVEEVSERKSSKLGKTKKKSVPKSSSNKTLKTAKSSTDKAAALGVKKVIIKKKK